MRSDKYSDMPKSQKYRKYELPPFLKKEKFDQEKYEKWLRRKAAAHVRRDRLRNKSIIKPEDYLIKIHQAVVDSRGLDYLTNEKLDWSLISKYDNDESKKQKGAYKEKFALLPSVDHNKDDAGNLEFRICAWRTNDAKNDLSINDFKKLCRLVLSND